MLLDRRVKKRELLQTIAEYRTLKIPKSIKFKAPAGIVRAPLLDIGVGGCALESPFNIPVKVILSIKIDPLLFAIGTSEKRRDPLEMTGRVSSSVCKAREHYRLGVSFVKIKKKDVGLIRRFMRSKERRRYLRFSFPR